MSAACHFLEGTDEKTLYDEDVTERHVSVLSKPDSTPAINETVEKDHFTHFKEPWPHAVY